LNYSFKIILHLLKRPVIFVLFSWLKIICNGRKNTVV
jgi:hypothetical protein